MLDRPIFSNHDRAFSLVSRLLARRSLSVALTTETDLRESGLTSLDMLHLMLAVESEFGITVPQNAMVPENFQSVVAIEMLVTSLQSNESISAVE
jgi:acyl carrier protein